jgi:general L-amino acid transport system substrate-binding protein
MNPALAVLRRAGYQASMGKKLLLVFILLASPAAAQSVLCSGTVAPGLAYPDVAGVWKGEEITLCAAIAKQAGATPVFTPILQDTDTPPPAPRSALFVPAGDIPAGYVAGPVIDDDYQAIMVPAESRVLRAADLAGAEICVEPGSPEDFNLIDYFARHNIMLREFVFQETDEMHDAYVAGRCDAITARKSLLIGLRANEDGPRREDRILPDNLGDNPIRAATPTNQPAWTALVANIIEDRHAP